MQLSALPQRHPGQRAGIHFFKNKSKMDTGSLAGMTVAGGVG